MSESILNGLVASVGIKLNLDKQSGCFKESVVQFFWVSWRVIEMETTIVVSAAVGSAALGARYLMRAWQAFKARPVVPPVRRFYPGGFEQTMTRREAALILGVREHTIVNKIREAHRRVMVANHPDAGGSHYLASKINEAKDILLRKTKAADSVF